MKKWFPILCIALVCFSFFKHHWNPVPKVWTEENLKGLMLPVADSTVTITHLPDSLYYSLPEMVIYRTYPFYLPGTEPEGYWDSLMTAEPEIVFNATSDLTQKEWEQLGELVYDFPQEITPIPYENTKVKAMIRQAILSEEEPLGKDSVIHSAVWVIREKGKPELGTFACATCHTRVMPDGKVFKGGQGNTQFDRNFGGNLARTMLNPQVPDSIKLQTRQRALTGLFSAPWIPTGLQITMKEVTNEEVIQTFQNTYGGVLHRHGSVLGAPTSIPDLYNLADRKYLDHTGLMQHRSPTDLMLYATLNQQADRYDRYNQQFSMVPWPSEGGPSLPRYSDAQLYALAQYLYSLKPPVNPNIAPPELLKEGKNVFAKAACVTCHTPPYFTNNQLTPAEGFSIPESHFERYAVFDASVETDPSLALESRRGTGYYKVPSLIAVWNRDALLHDGSIRSLEALLDSARLNEDYVTKGFKPGWKEKGAVEGHPFGLDLSEKEKLALIAYLRSL